MPRAKRRLKERSQLHRIVAQNCWLFGEEFNLSVDDQSLTEYPRKHRKLLGDNIAVDEPVKHVSRERGIVDLMLSRAIRRHGANELTQPGRGTEGAENENQQGRGDTDRRVRDLSRE